MKLGELLVGDRGNHGGRRGAEQDQAAQVQFTAADRRHRPGEQLTVRPGQVVPAGIGPFGSGDVGAVQLLRQRHLVVQRLVHPSQVVLLRRGRSRLDERDQVQVAAPGLVVTERQGTVRPQRRQRHRAGGLGREAVEQPPGLVRLDHTPTHTPGRPRPLLLLYRGGPPRQRRVG